MGRAARCRTPNPGNRDRVRSDVECARLASRLRGFRGGADRARGQLPRLPSARRRLSCPAPRRQGLEAASPSVFRPRRSDPDRCRGRISIRLDSPFGRTSQTDLAPRGLDGIHRGGGVHRGLAGDFEELEAGACRRSPRAAVGRSPQSKCECPFALGSGSRTRRSEFDSIAPSPKRDRRPGTWPCPRPNPLPGSVETLWAQPYDLRRSRRSRDRMGRPARVTSISRPTAWPSPSLPWPRSPQTRTRRRPHCSKSGIILPMGSVPCPTRHAMPLDS